MPWPKDHKAKIREKIVSAASAAVRARGASRIGVEEVMTSAGLTHGAFYAHFSSKDALVRAALEYAGNQTLERFSRLLEGVPPDERFNATVAAYLSSQHAAHPEAGCPVAALGPEVARTGGRTKRVLAEGIRRRLEWMRSLLPERLYGPREDEVVVGALACMVGAVVLARILGGEKSEAILKSTLKFLERALATKERSPAPDEPIDRAHQNSPLRMGQRREDDAPRPHRSRALSLS